LKTTDITNEAMFTNGIFSFNIIILMINVFGNIFIMINIVLDVYKLPNGNYKTYILSAAFFGQ